MPDQTPPAVSSGGELVPALVAGEERNWIEVHFYVLMPRGMRLLGDSPEISERLCRALEAEYITGLTLISHDSTSPPN